MRYVRRISVVVLLSVCAAGHSTAWAADEVGDRPASRRAVQKQLHHPLAGARAEAYRKLTDFPPLEAAKLLVQSGLSDRQPEVRRAAYQTLKAFRRDGEVGQYLLKALDKQMRAKTDAAGAGPLIAALLAFDSLETQAALGELLETWLARSKANAVVLIAVADELGAEADEQSLPSLRALARLKCFSDVFAFRRAVVQAMIRVQQPEAVGVLLPLLSTTGGEVRGDIVRYLARVTGLPEDSRPEAWHAWWNKHKDDFDLPVGAAAMAGPRKPAEGVKPRNRALEDLAVGETPSYYGVSVHARRMVFVLDISASMSGPRLVAAKRELVSTINALPEDSEFGIVAFNHVVTAWQSYLLPATATNKQKAIRFIVSLSAGGQTAAYDALETALRLDVEAIYFLTDGEPTAGKIVLPAAIVAAVGQVNRNRRISIYAIGVAPGFVDGPLDVFLREIAQQNFGLYRRVEQ